MATYVNDLRLKEITTGDESGTWGTSTNTNLELIAEAFSYGTEAITTNADTHTTTVADGATDPGRSLYLKYTGTLDSACTITLGPNTISKVWIIENATSGSQNIIIKQGSGTTVTIAADAVKVVYSDGAGSGASVVDAFQDVALGGTPTAANMTITSSLTADALIASTSLKTPLIEFTDGDDAITIADGGNITIGGTLDMNANELILDADADTSITADTDDQIDFKVGGTDRIKITIGSPNGFAPVTNHDVDLGTTSSAFRDLYIRSIGCGVNASGTQGEIIAQTKVTSAAFFYSSDAALKEDIQTIENPLEKVQQLRGVSYKWKDTGRKDIGLVANEVQKVLPELVADGEHKTMDYGHMIGLLVEAIKEQQKEIEELKK